MTPHEAYSITIHVRTVTLEYISHEKNGKLPLLNGQNIEVHKELSG